MILSRELGQSFDNHRGVKLSIVNYTIWPIKVLKWNKSIYWTVNWSFSDISEAGYNNPGMYALRVLNIKNIYLLIYL